MGRSGLTDRADRADRVEGAEGMKGNGGRGQGEWGRRQGLARTDTDRHGGRGALGRERKGRENCKLAIENFEFVIHSGTERTKRTKGARGVSGMRGTKADWHGLAGERNVG